MLDRPETHFFTGRGALCGASTAHRWSIVESLTTCAACRDLLEREPRRTPPGKPRTLVALGKIRVEP